MLRLRVHSRSAIFVTMSALSFAVTAVASEPPRAKTVPFSETLHGDTTQDPYRWMEGADPDYLPWLRGQEAYARTWLAALPKRERLLKGIEARSGAAASIRDIQAKGGRLFLERRLAGAQQTSLYVRAESGGAERLLFDPTSLGSEGGGNHAIDYWEASPTGRHVYVGVSPGGSELSTLRVIDVAAGKLLPEAAPLALFNYGASVLLGGLYPQWLPDGSGFYYRRLADNARPGTPDFFLNSRSFLHKVGSDPMTDVVIVEVGKSSKMGLPPIAIPMVIAQPGSRFALLIVGYGVQRAMAVYTAPLESAMTSAPTWRAVAASADQIEGVALSGEDIYLLRRDRARGRVLKTSAAAPSLATATEVVPESDAVLDRIVAAKDGIYLVERAAVGTRVRRLGFDGAVTQTNLPFTGLSYFQFASPQSDGLYVSLENYVTPRISSRVNGADAVDTGLAPKPPFATDAYVSETVLVSSRDGTKVPLDITHRRDTRRDGKRPVLLEAYGAYGSNIDPYFDPRIFSFLDEGAIYATAHVRGGGEFGRDWWQAGFQATKPNTWRDAIDCAQWLIDRGWTARGKITIWGTSAGGIMAGRAVTERPDLWAGGIASVGVLNPLRFEFGSAGASNVPEYGSVTTLEGYRALKAMDAYQAIRDGVAYPPMLLTAGMNDQRVIVWQPAKFVARLQAATIGGPVIFRVETDQGHGIGSSRSQLDNDVADVGAFALWAADTKQERTH
jgi:prolyl oligopeptidase